MSMRRVAASFLFLSFLCVEGAEQHKSFLIFSAVRAARRYFNIFMILFFFKIRGKGCGCGWGLVAMAGAGAADTTHKEINH